MDDRKTRWFGCEGTETLAKKQSDGTYKLYGYKWFTSATDADVSLTLARIIDEQGKQWSYYVLFANKN